MAPTRHRARCPLAPRDINTVRIAMLPSSHQHSAYTPLLFRQACLLAAIAGILAFRELWPGVIFLAFVWLATTSINNTLTHTLLLLLCFTGGVVYSFMRNPTAAPEPAWLHAAYNTPPEASRSGNSPPIWLKGTIGKVTPLSGDRIRFELHNTQPAAPITTAHESIDRKRNEGVLSESRTEPNPKQAEKSRETDPLSVNPPYTGTILMTWYKPTQPVLPGMCFKGLVRVGAMRSFHNPGTWNTEEYWTDRGITLRAWNSRSKGTNDSIHISGSPQWHTALRYSIKKRFLNALLQESTQEQDLALAKIPTTSTGSTPLPITPAKAMLVALVFGDRSFLTVQQQDLITRSTLAHSLALSGLHLGYSAAIGMSLVFVLGRITPSFFQTLPRSRLAVLLALPLVCLYTWVGSAPVSLLRALCMFLFWGLLLFWNKPKVMLDGLLMALAVLLFLQPAFLFDTSLQLSALSVAAIALFMPSITNLCHRLFPKPSAPSQSHTVLQKPMDSFTPTDFTMNTGEYGKGLSPMLASAFSAVRQRYLPSFLRASTGLLLVYLCIQCVTMPLVLRTFGVAGVWFPLNLLWLPILGALVMPFSFAGFFFAALGIMPMAEAFLSAAALPCHGLMLLLEAMDKANILIAPAMLRPHWISIAGFWFLCILASLYLRRASSKPQKQGLSSNSTIRFHPKAALLLRHKRFFMATCLGIAMVIAPLGYGYYAYYTQPVGLRLLDIGQGQAVLVEWPGGRALVDGGGFASEFFDVGKNIIAPALTNNRPALLSWTVATHPDTDHFDGLLYPLERFTVIEHAYSGDLPTGQSLERYTRALARPGAPRPKVWRQGDIIPLAPDLFFEVLWPLKTASLNRPGSSQKNESTNDASLVLRLVWKNRPLALLCGDVGLGPLQAMARQNPEALNAPVLILPHHGSKGSLSTTFYNAVHPEVALASCDYKNQWGFPAQAVKEELKSRGIPLFSTATHGQIGIHWASPDSAATYSFSRQPNASPVP